MTDVGGAPRVAKRQALVEATVVSLAALGPAMVQPSEICEELGISKALVNYHFGGREGLIAEAMAIGYERYVEELWVAANEAGDDPFDRLMAWFVAQITWTVDHPGLAVALNFPHVAAGLPDDFDPELIARLDASGTRNFENLTSLVAAVRATRPDGDSGDSTETVADAAVVGWVCLGISVWFAGNHLPTRSLRTPEILDLATEHVRSLIIAMLLR